MKKSTNSKVLLIITDLLHIIVGIAGCKIIYKRLLVYIPLIDKTVYGGDAFTGIQNAMAQTGNNISEFYTNFEYFIKFFIILFCIFQILKGIRNLIIDFSEFSEINMKNKEIEEFSDNSVQ